MSKPTQEWNYEEILKVQEELPLSITHALAARCQDYEDRIADMEEKNSRLHFQLQEEQVARAKAEEESTEHQNAAWWLYSELCNEVEDASKWPFPAWPWLKREDPDADKWQEAEDHRMDQVMNEGPDE